MHKFENKHCGKRFPVIFYHIRNLIIEHQCHIPTQGIENERVNRVEAEWRRKEKKNEFRKAVGEAYQREARQEY